MHSDYRICQRERRTRSTMRCEGDYHKVVEAKDKEGAQKCVKRLVDSVRALNKAHTNASSVARTIVLHQAEQTKIKEAYTFISSKSKDDIILTSPRRKILGNSAVIPPEVAMHTMAWLHEGHLTKRIHWLRGPRRCGKSTVLHRMASLCQGVAKPTGLNPAWVAGIAFDQPYDNESFVNHFLATVIHQIADRFDSVKAEFAKISACWDRETYFRETEFGEQVSDIFVALEPVIPRDGKSPIIISLDGLDNCDAVALDKAFSFIERTVDSKLPIYFIIAAPDTGRVQAYLNSGSLKGLVDVNDVPDFREMANGFAQIPVERVPSSRSDTVSKTTDSGISV
ncbi:hypothetical protein FA13DRAFT_686213 [Coprinellus micaceus]|uniref:Nephrocystin 3-like N-terminal domain-containing protein n=1 Tax=Coprinellus micaceus TaxID=71717 RepID=A0A4Y7T516_COPMI|nr:hypothetical protein FA13DRAFT_686213 [Coprinellus micaceus]